MVGTWGSCPFVHRSARNTLVTVGVVAVAGMVAVGVVAVVVVTVGVVAVVVVTVGVVVVVVVVGVG